MPPPDPQPAATAKPHAGPRLRRRSAHWLLVWSLAVAVVVAVLTMPVTDDSSPRVIRMQDAPSGESLTLEQAGQGLRLLHLSLFPAYPWILLAPYLLVFATRWRLESGRWLRNSPVLLAGAIAWCLATQFLNVIFGASRPDVIVFASVETRMSVEKDDSDVAPPAPKDRRSVFFRVGNGIPALPPAGRRTNGVFDQFTGDHHAWSKPLPLQSPGLPRVVEENLSRMHVALNPARRAGETGLTGLLLDLFAYASVVGVAHALHFHRRLREREHRALALESSLARARLHALQAQLQPHFLFNTLNSVTALLREDPRRAEEMLVCLSDLLRRALGSSDRPETTLDVELELADAYVEIQRHRFGPRLDFHKEIEDSARSCLVPTLLLQPLIENAIRHGVEPSARPVRVVVEARLISAHRLALGVRDDAPAADPGDPPRATSAAGVGLSNLRARLDALYGGGATVTVHSPPTECTHGFEVRMELPVRVATDNNGPDLPRL